MQKKNISNFTYFEGGAHWHDYNVLYSCTIIDAHVITKDNNGKTSDHSEEEDSWDKMFDDDGECLDPNAMEEVNFTSDIQAANVHEVVLTCHKLY